MNCEVRELLMPVEYAWAESRRYWWSWSLGYTSFFLSISYVNGNLDDSDDGESSDEGKAISLFVVVLITLVTLATVIVIVIVIDGDHIPILIIMIKKGDDCWWIIV